MMAAFIARMIMQAAEVSLEDGQNKYRAYFINTKLYSSFQSDVNTILNTTTSDKYPSGYGACIVNS